jgi:caffeoyl-CoA O-methyltransferase
VVLREAGRMASEVKSVVMTAEVAEYVVAHGTPPDAVQRDLIEETAALGGVSIMQIRPEQGAFMTMLAHLLGARRIVEVGTFTGYSALCLARGLAEGGTLLCCDVSEEWTAIARRAWERAGVADRITLRIGPAIETLRSLPADELVDLAFIDADKPSYGAYLDELAPRIRPGGLVLVDNVLWSGAVVDPAAQDENVRAIRAFNEQAAADERFDAVILPIADGLTLLRRR